MTEWGSPREKERRRRIMVSVAAYAYEYLDEPIMSDAKFDRMCQRIDVERSTGNKKMDRWFRENFDPSTGMWVHEHPNIAALANLAALILGGKHDRNQRHEIYKAEIEIQSSRPKTDRTATKKPVGKHVRRPGTFF